MKTFGSVEHIAVQVELLAPGEQRIVGGICLWAGGLRIGDDQQPVLLSPIADFFRSSIRFKDRHIDELVGLRPEQILGAIKTALFSPSENRPSFEKASRSRLAKYRKVCICPNGCEAFDGEMAVLIDREDSESFVWQDYADKRVHELRLERGGYEAVMRMFLAWIDPLLGHDPLTEHFADQVFVIFGNFSRPRSEIENLIRRLGGRVDRSLSARTSSVLVGEQMSQEPQSVPEARALGVPVLTEAQFWSLLPPGAIDMPFPVRE